MCYREYRCIIYKVGDLIDLIEFHMWFPILNTLILISFILYLGIIKMWELSKLNILLEKFRNIKLK